MLLSMSKWHGVVINYLGIEVVVMGVSDDGGAIRMCNLCCNGVKSRKKMDLDNKSPVANS